VYDISCLLDNPYTPSLYYYSNARYLSSSSLVQTYTVGPFFLAFCVCDLTLNYMSTANYPVSYHNALGNAVKHY